MELCWLLKRPSISTTVRTQGQWPHLFTLTTFLENSFSKGNKSLKLWNKEKYSKNNKIKVDPKKSTVNDSSPIINCNFLLTWVDWNVTMTLWSKRVRWWQFLIENLFYKNYVQSICLNYWGLGNLCIVLFCTVLNWHFRLVMIVRHNWNFSIWQIQIVRSKSLCIYFISYFDVFHNFVVLISPYIKLLNSQLISILKGPLKAWLVRS